MLWVTVRLWVWTACERLESPSVDNFTSSESTESLKRIPTPDSDSDESLQKTIIII